jgi:alpha-1,6-mannosyltransferase
MPIRMLETPPPPHLLDASMFWGAAGGVQRVLMARHALLHTHGWRHTIYAPGAQGPGLVNAGGVTLPGTGGYRAVLRREHAARAMQALLPDLIEAADPYMLGWAALTAARRRQIPAVAFCHSDLPALAARLAGGRGGTETARARWAERQARRYLVRFYNHFDLVLAPSRTLAARLCDWGVDAVQVQPLGVDCRVFDPRRRDQAWRRRLLRQLGAAPDTRLLVYAGRFAPEKNLQRLADAMALLGAGHLLVAVGEGPCPPTGPHVRTLPVERDPARLARLLASADAFVHAGDQETFGLAALEAMACGVPIVVSAQAGLGELAEDAGWRVTGTRPRDWAEGMHAALRNPLSPRVDTALARARAHDWRCIVERIDRRYRRLLGGLEPTLAPVVLPAGRATRAPHTVADR